MSTYLIYFICSKENWTELVGDNIPPFLYEGSTTEKRAKRIADHFGKYNTAVAEYLSRYNLYPAEKYVDCYVQDLSREIESMDYSKNEKEKLLRAIEQADKQNGFLLFTERLKRFSKWNTEQKSLEAYSCESEKGFKMVPEGFQLGYAFLKNNCERLIYPVEQYHNYLDRVVGRSKQGKFYAEMFGLRNDTFVQHEKRRQKFARMDKDGYITDLYVKTKTQELTDKEANVMFKELVSQGKIELIDGDRKKSLKQIINDYYGILINDGYTPRYGEQVMRDYIEKSKTMEEA